MQKLIELQKEENILVSSQLESFLKPDTVYLPVYKDKTILVHKGDFLKIGDEVVRGMLSPVSGYVQSLKKMKSLHHADYYLEIINNFEERNRKESGRRKKIDVQMLLSLLNLEGKKNLVLNAIDDEVYVSTQNFYLFLYYDVFLELLDEIAKLFPIENIYVCVKASSSENVSKLMSDLGMYPNIILRIVPDLYLLGRTSFLLSYLGLLEEETFVVLASSFYDVYNYLKRGRTKSDVFITISGNAVKNPMVVQVKIGSLLEDVVKELVQITQEDVLYFANGLMSGVAIDLPSFVVTDDLNSLIIMKKKEEPKEEKCIKCGLCSDICPVHLNPLLFQNKKYAEKMKEQCIKCGLCSYICPVYINFNSYMKGDNYE